MGFNMGRATRLVIFGLVLIALGGLLVWWGLMDGWYGTGSCLAPSHCTVWSTPLGAWKLVGGVVVAALGAGSLGAGWAYSLRGDARPQPTSSPDNQD